MIAPTTNATTIGVHSEVGRLRKVLVYAPGLAHRRLTPTNADDLLFDDVMWVENAQRDHADIVNKLRTRGSRWSSCTRCLHR
jgi:arginine deiminase